MNIRPHFLQNDFLSSCGIFVCVFLASSLASFIYLFASSGLALASSFANSKSFLILASAISFTCPLSLAFIFISALLVIGIFALAFIRISGRSLPLLLGNFLLYSFSSRIYLWKKKDLPPRIIWQKLENKNVPIRPDPSSLELRLAQKSRLKRVSSIVETKK